MKTMQLLAGALAGAVALSVPAFAIGAGPAVSSAALDQDKMQLSADQRALAREEARLQADRHTLAADTRSGKMSAMSEDSEKIYKDQQYIKGEKADTAHDKAGSLQMKSDRDALWREEKQLTSDRTKLREDTESGKMSAMSDDAERVYRDRQEEGSQSKQIRADRAKLAADEKARTASRADYNRVSAIEASVAAAQLCSRLIDLAIEVGGSFMPAWLPAATRAQAEACYPMLGEFLAEKRRLDPDERAGTTWARSVHRVWRAERCRVRFAGA